MESAHQAVAGLKQAAGGLKQAVEVTFPVPTSEAGKKFVAMITVMILGGLLASWLYHGTIRNVQVEFTLWSPLVFGVSVWESRMIFTAYGMAVADNGWKSLAILAACLIFNGLLVG